MMEKQFVNSEYPPCWKNFATGILVLVSLILIVRLGWMVMASFRTDPPQTIEEAFDLLRAAGKKEREDWERRWRESGHPPPPGGFDAAWNAARGTVTEDETLPSLPDGQSGDGLQP